MQLIDKDAVLILGLCLVAIGVFQSVIGVLALVTWSIIKT